MAGALEGIRILDLTSGVAGGVGVLLLAEQGAEVIKIEPPAGDAFREYHGSAVWYRSRRSVILDLSSPADMSAFWRLVETSDVLVESSTPGTMERLGIGYEAVHGRNPRLVYCSLSAWPVGHRNEQRSGWDGLVQAAAGLQFDQPGWRPGPIYNYAPTPSLGALFLVPTGILAALHEREESGRGQHVRTSLLQGAFLYTSQIWQSIEHNSALFHEMMAKTYPPGIHQAMIFETADGWIHVSALSGNVITKTQDEIVGLDDLPPLGVMRDMKPEDQEAISEKRRQAYRRWTTDELTATMRQHGHAVEPIITAEQALADPHPQLAANDMVVDVVDAELGRTTQMGVPIHLLGTPGAIVSGRPKTGADTNAILSALPVAAPLSIPRATSTPATGAVLGGLTLIDFGQYLAGPFGPMILGDLGMDVIKVEPVTGDNMRMAIKPFNGCQRGKRSIALNVKTPEGLEIALELVKRADVVHHNMTKGTATKLGIDYERCRDVNPEVIYCNTYAYGLHGPLSASGGLDPLYQATAGIEYEGGATAHGHPPLYVRFGFCDTANAMLSVVGVLAALVHRDRTGRGQELWTSLLDGGAVFAADAMLIDGQPVGRPRLDAGQHGIAPNYRLYQTQDDSWIMVCAVSPAQWQALCNVVGAPELAAIDSNRLLLDPSTPERAAIEATLETRFRARTAWSWHLYLDDAGVPNELTLDTQHGTVPLYDADNVALGLVAEHVHPIHGRERQLGHVINFSETPGRIAGPAPLVGQHTREVMDWLGYSSRRVDELIGTNVIYEPDETYRQRFLN